MAGHLAAAGHRVRVYNRTSSRADAWLAATTEHSSGGVMPHGVRVAGVIFNNVPREATQRWKVSSATR